MSAPLYGVYIFNPSTAASPHFIESSEVNQNFQCLTEVIVNTLSGHDHDHLSSRIAAVRSGVARLVTTDGITVVSFVSPFSSSLSFSVTTALLANTSVVMQSTPTVLITPNYLTNTGFTMTLVNGTTGVPVDCSADKETDVGWMSYCYVP